jgi:sugar phosphate isomerase/epimerase
MKKGFQQWTVRDLIKTKAGASEVFKKTKEMGYDSIQGYYVEGVFGLEDYKNMILEAGLENCSSSGSFEEMRKGVEGIKKAVDEAHYLGSDLVALGTLPKEYRESREGYKKYAAEVNTIIKDLKKEGLKMVYHPHAIEFFSFGGGLKGMDIIFEETDPDGFWFCLDTHWLVAGGVNPLEWIRKTRGRGRLIHFKDYAIVKAAIDGIEEVHRQFAEVGEGNLNWTDIIAVCKETGIEHAIVEQDICPGYPLDSLKISIGNMRAFTV